MKDVVIKGHNISLALWTLLGCYIVMNIVNIIAIASYSTSWNEIFTMQGFVVIFSIALFLLVGFIYVIVKMLIPKKKK